MFDRSGKAYPQGRFRGESFLYREGEWRFPVKKEKKIRTIFVNGSILSGSQKPSMLSGRANYQRLFDTINPGYGIGLRVNINKKQNNNRCGLWI